MKEVYKKYPVASNEPLEDNTYLSYNMVIGTSTDKKLYQAFEILDYALLNAPAAPLKKALIDAGIGKDIMGSYDNGVYQPMFSIVAKNANKSDKERFVNIIQSVLKEQAQGGLNKKSLLAGINSGEFRYRESDFGHYPKGLIYGLQMFDSWLYDDTIPFMHIEAGDTFKFLREQVETDYFEKLIQDYMIDNTHVSMVVIEPEHGLNAKNEKALAEKLEKFKNGLKEEEIHGLIQDTKHLKQYQEEPSRREDIEKIPMLKRSDMKREAMPFVNEERECAGFPVLFHNIFSNGIIYLDLLFDIRKVAQEDLPYLGILKAVLGYMDSAYHTYGDLADEINMETGGMSAAITAYPSAADDTYYEAKFELKTKVLYDKLSKAIELMKEIICDTDFTDEKRLHEILSEVKSRLQMSLSSSGNSVSAIRAMSYFSETALFNDMTMGIDFYRVVADYEENFEAKKKELIHKLNELRRQVCTREGLLISVTCDEEGYKKLPESLEKLQEGLPEMSSFEENALLHCEKKNEGFMDASKVQYVSRAGNFKKAGFSYTGALKILRIILSYDYLWNNIRVKGGAYGCSSGFARNGNAYFSSYRDPNLEKTNEVYEKIPGYIRKFHADERDMTKYIIGTVSEMDTPLNPNAKGSRSTLAYLSHVSFEDIQKERDEVINATEEDIKKLSDLVEAVLSQENICVIGNEEKVREQKELFFSTKELL